MGNNNIFKFQSLCTRWRRDFSRTESFLIRFSTIYKHNRDLKYIKSKGILSGLAINPDTDYKELYKYYDNMDYILIMSVFPGFGGQSFITSTLDTMNYLVNDTKDKKILIGVDGGVNLSTIKKVYDTGIDITIVGSGLYGAKNIKERYGSLMGSNN